MATIFTADAPHVEYIPLGRTAKYFPSRPHHATIIRWARKGTGGMKLRTVKSGQRYYTTRQWINEFLAECNRTDAERLEREGC